uniref:Uncharacterized protein n=1 Tax=Malurus cyaneus samueli TaxID=2593467 RepID=A0A8C5X1T3_9PASS
MWGRGFPERRGVPAAPGSPQLPFSVPAPFPAWTRRSRGAAEEEEEKGAEDRALSAQASVGNRSEGEGEAASADHSPQATGSPAGTAWPGPTAAHTEVQVKTPRVNCPEKVVQDQCPEHLPEDD